MFTNVYMLLLGRTAEGGRSRHLLEIAFSEPLRRTLFYCKTHSRTPSQNPSENPFPEFPRTLPRTFSEPFLECCVAVRPLGRAPNTLITFEELRIFIVGSFVIISQASRIRSQQVSTALLLNEIFENRKVAKFETKFPISLCYLGGPS